MFQRFLCFPKCLCVSCVFENNNFRMQTPVSGPSGASGTSVPDGGIELLGNKYTSGVPVASVSGSSGASGTSGTSVPDGGIELLENKYTSGVPVASVSGPSGASGTSVPVRFPFQSTGKWRIVFHIMELRQMKWKESKI